MRRLLILISMLLVIHPAFCQEDEEITYNGSTHCNPNPCRRGYNPYPNPCCPANPCKPVPYSNYPYSRCQPQPCNTCPSAPCQPCSNNNCQPAPYQPQPCNTCPAPCQPCSNNSCQPCPCNPCPSAPCQPQPCNTCPAPCQPCSNNSCQPAPCQTNSCNEQWCNNGRGCDLPDCTCPPGTCRPGSCPCYPSAPARGVDCSLNVLSMGAAFLLVAGVAALILSSSSAHAHNGDSDGS